MNEQEKTDKIKLPKQWKDWCRAASLHKQSKAHPRRGIRHAEWFYLQGYGREWRVDRHNMLQCGDTYADFDRWALCNICEAPMPKTRAEFITTVKSLILCKSA